MSDRLRLPDRRPCTSHSLEWRGQTWIMGLGWSADGSVREIFLSGAKTGTDLEIGTDDDCLLVSKLLQHGEPISALAESLVLNRTRRAVSCDTGQSFPSLISTAISAAAVIEREDGAAMAYILALTNGAVSP